MMTCQNLSDLSETWLHNMNDDLFQMPGYKFVCNSKEHKLGGEGVGRYIQCDLKFKLRSDLQATNTSLYESIVFEIVQTQEKNIIVGCFY